MKIRVWKADGIWHAAALGLCAQGSSRAAALDKLAVLATERAAELGELAVMALDAGVEVLCGDE